MKKKEQTNQIPNKTKKGVEFETYCENYLTNKFLNNVINSKTNIGIDIQKKINKDFKKFHKYDMKHKFDLYDKDYVIECKSYKWSGKNKKVPSAKIDILALVMYYFRLANENKLNDKSSNEQNKKKILCIEKQIRNKKNGHQSIADYFIENREFLIPDENVYILEVDTKNNKIYKKWPM